MRRLPAAQGQVLEGREGRLVHGRDVLLAHGPQLAVHFERPGKEYS